MGSLYPLTLDIVYIFVLILDRIFLLGCCGCENVAGTQLVLNSWKNVLLSANSMYMELLFQFTEEMPINCSTRYTLMLLQDLNTLISGIKKKKNLIEITLSALNLTLYFLLFFIQLILAGLWYSSDGRGRENCSPGT